MTNFNLAMDTVLTIPSKLSTLEGKDQGFIDYAKMNLAIPYKNNDEDLKNYCFQYIWMKYNYCNIESQKLATKMLFLSIYLGNTLALKLLQESLLLVGLNISKNNLVSEKGIGKINTLINLEGDESIIKILELLQKDYYIQIFLSRPNTLTLIKSLYAVVDAL